MENLKYARTLLIAGVSMALLGILGGIVMNTNPLQTAMMVAIFGMTIMIISLFTINDYIKAQEKIKNTLKKEREKALAGVSEEATATCPKCGGHLGNPQHNAHYKCQCIL